MTQLQRLVEHIVPAIYDEGHGPFWLSFYGDWDTVDFDNPEPEGPDGEQPCFHVLSGPFGTWWPDPDCRAILVVVPCSTTATGQLHERGRHGAGAPRFSGWHPGTMYLAVDRDDESFALEVGEDGPRTRGRPTAGTFLDVVRSKFGFGPGPAVPGARTC